MIAQTVENILQAFAAGLLLGTIYGLMCVGLGLIFGVMRVINFAQGDFMMLGMYAAYYILTFLGVSTLFGATYGPFVAAIMAGPVVFVVGYVLHRLLISRVTGMRTAALDGEGHYAQLILTLGIALMLQNGGLILFGSVPQRCARRSPSSAWEIGPLWGDHVSVFVNQSRGVAALLTIGVIAAVWLFISRSTARQGAARRRRQPRCRHLHGHRRRPGASLRLRARRRHHRASPAGCSPPTIRSIPMSGWTS